MGDWKKTINQVVGSEQIQDISSFTQVENTGSYSALDNFYLETQKVMSTALPSKLDENDWLGTLYLISIVSTTENYFREILGKIIKICPVSQKCATTQNINFGSVIWHPSDEVERGAFEHLSLASSKLIQQTTNKYIGVDLKKEGLGAILNEFNKICELRHGIVHSNRVIAGKNGINLDLERSGQRTKVVINYARFQEVCSICTTLVVSCNLVFFETMVHRWATYENWRKPSWETVTENKYFKNIWEMFYSQKDSDNNSIENKCSWIKCKNMIKKEYNI